LGCDGTDGLGLLKLETATNLGLVELFETTNSYFFYFLFYILSDLSMLRTTLFKGIELPLADKSQCSF